MTRRCFDTLRGDRCEKPADHDGPHKRGSHTWDSRDIPVPEWRKRGTFRRDLVGVES